MTNTTGVVQMHNLILTMIFLMIQFGALVWYALSYIPFARELISRLVTNFLGE